VQYILEVLQFYYYTFFLTLNVGQTKLGAIISHLRDYIRLMKSPKEFILGFIYVDDYLSDGIQKLKTFRG